VGQTIFMVVDGVSLRKTAFPVSKRFFRQVSAFPSRMWLYRLFTSFTGLWSFEPSRSAFKRYVIRTTDADAAKEADGYLI
jgi:hypothetical protein